MRLTTKTIGKRIRLYPTYPLNVVGGFFVAVVTVVVYWQSAWVIRLISDKAPPSACNSNEAERNKSQRYCHYTGNNRSS